MNILYTEKFKRLFRKLPKNIQFKTDEKEALFKNNPFNRSLKTHKLNGRFCGYWAFSVGYQYRIIFRFTKKDEVLFLAIGDHSIYD